MESELARVQRALVVTESARLKAEFELGVAQQALAIVGEACKKAEEENNNLTEEHLSLIIELGVNKDEFAAFWEKAVVEKEAMEAEFDASSDVLFNYGYGCCAFAHNICGSKPLIPVGMPDMSNPLPPKFFVNPRCPPSASSATLAANPLVIGREKSSAESLAVAKDGVDVPSEPSAKAGGESIDAVEG